MGHSLSNSISQESVRLWLFPFSLIGEALKWLDELSRNFITSFEELVTAFSVWFLPPLKIMTIRANIQSFKPLNREPLHETCLRFNKMVLQCPTYGLPDNVLLQYFYRRLDSVNKGVAKPTLTLRLMEKLYSVEAQFHYSMTNINKVRYTRKYRVSPVTFKISKEKI